MHWEWPQAVQVVLMTIMPPHWQQYSKAGILVMGCVGLKSCWTGGVVV